MSLIDSLRVVGTAGFEKEDCLPCRIFPIFATQNKQLYAAFADEFELVSNEEFIENGSCYLPESFQAKENHCLLQTGANPNTWEYIPEDNLEKRLAELGIEAVKNAKSFLDEGKEDEAEKLLWYAARAMPKSASVLMLLRVVLKGKISEEEMNVLNQNIEKLMVVNG